MGHSPCDGIVNSIGFSMQRDTKGKEKLYYILEYLFM